MTDWNFDDILVERPPDPAEEEAEGILADFFEKNSEAVFFSRQLEVRFEDLYFHWVTNRAIRSLVEQKVILTETRRLSTGGDIKLLWHRKFRYFKRAAVEVVRLVEEYAHPNIGGALGLQGEFLTLEAFARHQFVLLGREVKRLGEVEWSYTDHDIDLVFEKDGVRYGIEVKNTLGYMDHTELVTKVRLSRHLGCRPVFVVRMAPKSWVYEVARQGGFVLMLKYQLYPWTHAELAKRVATELGLPVDTPRSLADGTMQRFLRYHRKNV